MIFSGTMTANYHFPSSRSKDPVWEDLPGSTFNPGERPGQSTSEGGKLWKPHTLSLQRLLQPAVEKICRVDSSDQPVCNWKSARTQIKPISRGQTKQTEAGVGYWRGKRVANPRVTITHARTWHDSRPLGSERKSGSSKRGTDAQGTSLAAEAMASHFLFPPRQPPTSSRLRPHPVPLGPARGSLVHRWP